MAMALGEPVRAGEPVLGIFPEQRGMRVRTPSQIRVPPLPKTPTPPTVSTAEGQGEEAGLGLNEAIRTALANSEVVRVLAGTRATSSGSTIYDPAVTNTQIDVARALFDPTVQVENTFSQRDAPIAILDPSAPGGVRFGGTTTEGYDLTVGAQQRFLSGGQAAVSVTPDRSAYLGDADPLLNPQSANATALSFTQPLLQGAGRDANMAPIVIAQINTERSFFQLKDSVQQMVLGVIQAYWNLVATRTNVWAREQQVKQGEEAYERSQARLRIGLGDLGEVAQTRSALADFQASLLAARAMAIQRESALRDLLGLLPYDGRIFVPVSRPAVEPQSVRWEDVVELAQRYRPDLIELKLVLEADQQQLITAENQALPEVNATAMYYWNGLSGRTPDRTLVSTGSGDYTGWELGVTFSVPLGLRSERANLRRQELIVTRDRANLQQGLHNAVHTLATSYRNLDWYFEQYRAYQEARLAARLNLDRQLADFRAGRQTIFLNVLQAITNWGNSVSSEAEALVQYNIELANLSVETGTILEAHGIRFAEERYGSIGPLGRIAEEVCYPKAKRPTANEDRYPVSDAPAEQVFDLTDPLGPVSPRAVVPEPAEKPDAVPPPEPAPVDAAVPPPKPAPGGAPGSS